MALRPVCRPSPDSPDYKIRTSDRRVFFQFFHLLDNFWNILKESAPFNGIGGIKEMPSEFFAMLSRMKYIDRWGLMRNTRQENLSEHSFETAILAHALATLRNVRFGGHVQPERAAVLALFHDAPETLTGDLPTPVKYYNPDIRGAYRAVERAAEQTLLSLLPGDLQDSYAPLLGGDSESDAELHKLVKAADKLSALIKCLEERRMGNTEFLKAEESLWKAVRSLHLPEADCFLDEFLPAYSLTLDETQPGQLHGEVPGKPETDGGTHA